MLLLIIYAALATAAQSTNSAPNASAPKAQAAGSPSTPSRGVSAFELQAAVLSFKGLPLGMDLADFKSRVPHADFEQQVWDPTMKGKSKMRLETVTTPLCSDRWNEIPGFGSVESLRPGEIVCNVSPGSASPEYKIVAGEQMESVIFHFYKSHLYLIAISFKSNDYATLKAAFVQKFGQPDSKQLHSYQNGFGATWQGEQLSWKRGSRWVGLNEGANNGPRDSDDLVGSGSAFFSDDSLAPPQEKPVEDF